MHAAKKIKQEGMLMYDWRWYLFTCTLAFFLSIGAVPSAESVPTIVVIDFTLQDDMVPGPGRKAPGAEDVARRTKMLHQYFVDALKESDKYRLMEPDRESEAYKELMTSRGHLFQCKQCIASYGKAVGSDYVLHGWVQRVSNLIINLNVEILDSESAELHDRAYVDTRGNTDKSWMDGASFLKRHLLYGL